MWIATGRTLGLYCWPLGRKLRSWRVHYWCCWSESKNYSSVSTGLYSGEKESGLCWNIVSNAQGNILNCLKDVPLAECTCIGIGVCENNCDETLELFYVNMWIRLKLTVERAVYSCTVNHNRVGAQVWYREVIDLEEWSDSAADANMAGYTLDPRMRKSCSCPGKAEDKANSVEEEHCELLGFMFWFYDGVFGVWEETLENLVPEEICIVL
jgi:hypothetical protein